IFSSRGFFKNPVKTATTSTCVGLVANPLEMRGSSFIKRDCTAELGGREAKVTGPLYYSQ
ncbi:MAG: hypothetical protein ACTHLC_06195, partial [Rhizobiaceae bacterium]